MSQRNESLPFVQQPHFNGHPSSSQMRGYTYDEHISDRNMSRREGSRTGARNAGENPSESSSILSTPNGDVEISGGTFNATAGHHLTVTINNAGRKARSKPAKRTPQKNRQTSKKRKRTSGYAEDESVSERDTSSRAAKSMKISNSTEFEDRVITSSLSARHSDILKSPLKAQPPVISSQTSYSLYYRHLAYKGRGSPLWIPQPNKNLPIEYQRTGMQIGDVGIISSRGSFVFLFNICYPAAHPINHNKVPPNFIPLILHPADEIRAESEFGPGSYLSSASIRKSNRDMNSSGLIFESSAAEGAILAMPVGSKSEDLIPVLRFQRYAAQHAEEWYRYVIDVRECPVNNGDIRLVIGHDKTSAWGVATFSDSTEHNSLFLSFHPIDESSAGRVYGWEYSGMAEVRNGPDPRDVEDLRRGDLSQEHVTFDNQCLFVRTVNVKLQDRAWKVLASELGMIDIDSDNNPTGGPDTSRELSQNNLPKTSHSNRSSHATNNSLDYQGRYQSFFMTQKESPSVSTTSSVYVSQPVPALTEHPSGILNTVLLDLFSGAKIAVTSDHDWISLLTPGDNCLPPKEELSARIRSSFRICFEEEVVFLENKINQIPVPDNIFENAELVKDATDHSSSLNPETMDLLPVKSFPPSSSFSTSTSLEALLNMHTTNSIIDPDKTSTTREKRKMFRKGRESSVGL